MNANHVYYPEISAFEYISLNNPTIADIRHLNKETLLGWPLGVLAALADCGIDIDKCSTAVIKWGTYELEIDGQKAMASRYRVVIDGRVIGYFREDCEDDGSFVPMSKLRTAP